MHLQRESHDEFIVIETFYKDPWAVRELAKNVEYAGKGTLSRNVAGIESMAPYFTAAVVDKFENAIGSKIDVDLFQNAFGRFRLGLKNDVRRTRVHYDNTDWTAVVYLTPDLSITHLSQRVKENKIALTNHGRIYVSMDSCRVRRYYIRRREIGLTISQNRRGLSWKTIGNHHRKHWKLGRK